jgi:dTDP-4-amino-4,6-dideoxygalactose transaminase
MDKIFPLVRPDVPKLRQWTNFVKPAYKLGIFSNKGPVWQQLSRETELLFPGMKTAGIANNTVGLVATLQAMEVFKKDVFLSNYTFAATLHAAILAGANPVLCDVDRCTWEISVQTLQSAVAKFGKPKVVILTRVFGQRLSIDKIASYCSENGIALIVDSAAAFPSPALPPTHLDAFEIFSFHATKVMSIGEGGLLAGKVEDVDKVLRAVNFGLSSDLHFGDGINAKMDEFAAARALGALKLLERNRKKRKLFVERAYEGLFQNHALEVLNPGSDHLWSLFPLKFKSPAARDAFQISCTQLGLTTKPYYSPSMSSGYKGLATVRKVDNLDVSDELSRTVLCLPVYSRFSSKEVNRIAEIIKIAQLEI